MENTMNWTAQIPPEEAHSILLAFERAMMTVQLEVDEGRSIAPSVSIEAINLWNMLHVRIAEVLRASSAVPKGADAG